MTMKKLAAVTEVPNEGYIALLGKVVVLLCATYFYAGKLVGVNDECVMIEDAHLIYETGEWSAKTWKDAQKLPADVIYINKVSVESFFEVKK